MGPAFGSALSFGVKVPGRRRAPPAAPHRGRRACVSWSVGPAASDRGARDFRVDDPVDPW